MNSCGAGSAGQSSVRSPSAPARRDAAGQRTVVAVPASASATSHRRIVRPFRELTAGRRGPCGVPRRRACSLCDRPRWSVAAFPSIGQSRLAFRPDFGSGTANSAPRSRLGHSASRLVPRCGRRVAAFVHWPRDRTAADRRAEHPRRRFRPPRRRGPRRRGRRRLVARRRDGQPLRAEPDHRAAGGAEPARRRPTLPFDVHLMIERPAPVGARVRRRRGVQRHLPRRGVRRPGGAGQGPALGRGEGRAGDRPGHPDRAVPGAAAQLRHPADHDDQGRLRRAAVHPAAAGQGPRRPAARRRRPPGAAHRGRRRDRRRHHRAGRRRPARTRSSPAPPSTAPTTRPRRYAACAPWRNARPPGPEVDPAGDRHATSSWSSTTTRTSRVSSSSTCGCTASR